MTWILDSLAALRDRDARLLLAVLHYITAAMELSFAGGAAAFVFVVKSLAAGEFPDAIWIPSEPVAGFLVAFGGLAVVLGIVLGALTLVAGVRIGRGTHLAFCKFVAYSNLFLIPWGTLLGVFALGELSKPEVEAQFAPAQSSRR